MDAFELEIYKHLFVAVTEEMGTALRRSSYSPNIKERLDFSCALFNEEGQMISQAAHIPVHLGAMPLSIQSALQVHEFHPGDVVIHNSPFFGGTHLPDITLISPIFIEPQGGKLVGFAASRAHHADVGGISPGSMSPSNEIYQEGLIIPPVKLVEGGRWNSAVLELVLANVRTPEERKGDILAQFAANRLGVERTQRLVSKYGLEEITQAGTALLRYTERMTRDLLGRIPDGSYRFEDRLDDDGQDIKPVHIRVAITIEGDEATVDFHGSSPQTRGNVNAVLAITTAATYYVFRSLLGQEVPSNSGSMIPIHIKAPPGSVVNAQLPSAVAAGNVETSQRITDVLLGALAQALPHRIPAASQGTMNNLTIGGWDPGKDKSFTYYETIGGGMGARPDKHGSSGIHTHMTNTMNTPVEALEFAYPFRVSRYALRQGSGGGGKWLGGEGIIREYLFFHPAEVSILSERRVYPPYGLAGGEPGSLGLNTLIRGSESIELPGKCRFSVQAGDILRIETPGGGGFGVKDP